MKKMQRKRPRGFPSSAFTAIILAVSAVMLAGPGLQSAFCIGTESSGTCSYTDIPYSVRNGIEQQYYTLDIHRPENGGNMPVAVYFHGGTWVQGDKKSAENKIRLFTERGIILVSVNYPLSPDVVFPEHVEAAAASLDWLRSNIENYGGNPEAMFLMGHSAGGHIAASLALNPGIWLDAGIQPVIPRGIICLDTAAYSIEDLYNAEPENTFLFRMAFGDTPEAWAEASPITYTDSEMPHAPFLIIYVTSRKISETSALKFAWALKTSNRTALLVPVENRDHVSIERRLGEPDDPAADAILGFISRLLP